MSPPKQTQVAHRFERVLRLIDKWLTVGVVEDGQWTECDEGSPQGASRDLSALLHACPITLSAAAGGTLLPVRWSVERTAGTLLVVALVLAGAGINSGTALNFEMVRQPAGMLIVGCGSPWAPDYAQAERADLAAFPQMHSVAHACRNHNDAEALVADAAAPGGLLIALTMLGVIVFGARRRQVERPRSPVS